MIISQDQPRNRPGIYKIENTITGKVYVGSSGRIKRRWNDHVSYLKSNRHHCRHLQNSYNMYLAGSDNDDFIVFTVLELMPDSTKLARLEREEWWIATFISEGVEVYNSNLKPTSQYGMCTSSGVRNSVATEYKPGNIPWTSTHGHDAEARALIGEKAKQMWENPETAAKLRQSRQSEEFRSGRAQSMRDAWITNREKLLAGMQTEEYKAASVAKTKRLWAEGRDKMLSAMRSPATAKKRLITAVGEEIANKLLDTEWLISTTALLGKGKTAQLIGARYDLYKRWYDKALEQAGQS